MATFRRQGRRATGGALLILGLAVLALLVFFADEIQRRLRPTYRIHAVLPAASAVEPGTPVTVAGVEAGWVTHITLTPADSDSALSAALTLELETAVRLQVRRDSRVHVRQRRLISESFVDVLPGSPAAPVLPAGDTLRPAARPDLEDVMAQADALRPALDSLARAAYALAAAWRATQPAAARLRRRAAAAQAELRALGQPHPAGAAVPRVAWQEWRSALDRTRAAATAIRRFRSGGRPDAAPPAAELARLATRAQDLAAEFARLEAALASPAAMPRGSARDSALARALRSARAELDSLVAETRRNPLRFLF